MWNLANISVAVNKHQKKSEGAVDNGKSRDTRYIGGKPLNEDNQASSPTENT